jgi:hypothetical protein
MGRSSAFPSARRGQGINGEQNFVLLEKMFCDLTYLFPPKYFLSYTWNFVLFKNIFISHPLPWFY